MLLCPAPFFNADLLAARTRCMRVLGVEVGSADYLLAVLLPLPPPTRFSAAILLAVFTTLRFALLPLFLVCICRLMRMHQLLLRLQPTR